MLLKSCGAYQDAFAIASKNPKVQEVLGNPIKEGWYLTGQIHVSGPSGRADIAFPISGPKGEATVYAVATKSAGIWTFSVLAVDYGGPNRINLLNKSEMD